MHYGFRPRWKGFRRASCLSLQPGHLLLAITNAMWLSYRPYCLDGPWFVDATRVCLGTLSVSRTRKTIACSDFAPMVEGHCSRNQASTLQPPLAVVGASAPDAGRSQGPLPSFVRDQYAQVVFANAQAFATQTLARGSPPTRRHRAQEFGRKPVLIHRLTFTAHRSFATRSPTRLAHSVVVTITRSGHCPGASRNRCGETGDVVTEGPRGREGRFARGVKGARAQRWYDTRLCFWFYFDKSP